MRWTETLRIALEAIRTHKMRSALTMLGIFIGIAAVTLTVGLGQGAQKAVSDQISSLGSNLLIVSPGSSSSGGVRGGMASRWLRGSVCAARMSPGVSRMALPFLSLLSPSVSSSAAAVR